MKLFKKNILKIYLIFILSTLYLHFSFRDLNVNDYKDKILELEKGKIYTNLERINHNLGNVTIVGIIHGDIQSVWKIVNSDSKYVYPDILDKAILKKSGNYYIKKSLLDFPWPLSNRWTVYEEIIDDKEFGKEWKEIGGDIRINRGAIKLIPYKNNSTIMIFKLSFDPGLPFVPEWAIEMGMKYKAPSIIERVRYCLKHCKLED